MLSLDDHETGIVLMALNHFEWTAKSQLDPKDANDATQAAWYATRYCLAEARKLIARIEQYQKDEAEKAEENRRANAAR